MKTIRQWLSELPEPYRTQSLDNLPSKSNIEKVSSMQAALINGFEWDKSPQGTQYWVKLVKSL